MAEAITKFGSVNLPTPDALVGALGKLEEQYKHTSLDFMKFAKGHWSYGKEDVEPEPGSRWAINPFSFVHGFVAFGSEGTPRASELLGEHMVAMTEPKPEVGPAPDDARGGWQEQLGFVMRCMTGEDEGVEVRYNSNSKGGVRAIGALIGELRKQTMKDPTRFIPVVELQTSFYLHKTAAYGKVWIPVFKVVDWISGDDVAAEAIEAEVVEAEVVQTAPAPEQRRRRSRS